MDIYVTFWNSDRKRVESMYFETDFMGHTTVNDLLNSFQSKLEPFSAAKLLPVGMDGPNVNWSFYDKLNNEHNELTFPELLRTGNCGLHIYMDPLKLPRMLLNGNWPRFSKVFINCSMIHQQGGQIILY